MWVKIMEVDGKPVKKRFSLGGAMNYIEAGEVKEVDDEIGEMLCSRNFCTVEQPPNEYAGDPVVVGNGPGEDEEESEVRTEDEGDTAPNY